MAIDKSKEKPDEKKATKKPARSFKPSWDQRYDQCIVYRKENGNCKIPTGFKENKGLGIWVQEQRRNYKLLKQGKKPRAKLTDEQIAKLDDIEFHWGFKPDPNSAESDASWQANFEKLKEYKESNGGDFDVPMETFAELAKWTRAQRNQYNLRATKRKTFITKERVKQLEGIGFDWGGLRN